MRISSTAARLASASRNNATNAGADDRPSGDVSLMRTLSMGTIAIGLAAVVAVVPAASAQDPRVPGDSKPAGTAVPIGKVHVGPEFVEGEPIYVRRTTVRPGMIIVEVSTTPFVAVLPSKEQAAAVVRPDQPASW